ncbi:MAG: HAD family hydrolase [Muribaculum sp.]|nr:HAD family hydrolase [Muribaculum sp.]
MTTLYVSDMDGTLLNDNSRVSDVSAGIISGLSREGALITVATARTPATVEPLLSDTYTSIPAIVMTGASFWNRADQSYLETRFIQPATAERIRGIAREHGVHPFVYTLGDDGVLNVYKDSPLTELDRTFIDERRGLKLKRFLIDSPDASALSDKRTMLMFASGPKNVISETAADLREKVDCSPGNYLDIFDPAIGYLDVYASGINKAEAVRRLAAKVGAERVVVFGDNLNDIPMMKAADVAVAVENALPEVKEAAHRVIGLNTDDSVARFIEADYRQNRNN